MRRRRDKARPSPSPDHREPPDAAVISEEVFYRAEPEIASQARLYLYRYFENDEAEVAGTPAFYSTSRGNYLSYLVLTNLQFHWFVELPNEETLTEFAQAGSLPLDSFATVARQKVPPGRDWNGEIFLLVAQVEGEHFVASRVGEPQGVANSIRLMFSRPRSAVTDRFVPRLTDAIRLARSQSGLPPLETPDRVAEP